MPNISKTRLKELVRKEIKLTFLEDARVDEWAGYEEVMEAYNKVIEKEEQIQTLAQEIFGVLATGVVITKKPCCPYEFDEQVKEVVLNILKDFADGNK